MQEKIKLLDHGYVKLHNIASLVRRPNQPFDASSRDPAIAARMSFNNGGEERTFEQDMKLVNYLIQHIHNTPIEMTEVWLEMKLPIFLARQFVRHRTATLNEVSGRYVTLPEEWYIPDIVGGKAENVKQGQEDNLPLHVQEEFRNNLNGICAASYQKYLYHLKQGVAAEHARMFLHVNHYTKWIWKQDLHNMLHFIKIRSESHAQVEAQVYARAMLRILEEVIPELIKLRLR